MPSHQSARPIIGECRQSAAGRWWLICWLFVVAVQLQAGIVPLAGQLVVAGGGELESARNEFRAAEAAFRASVKAAARANKALAFSGLENGKEAALAWIRAIHDTNPQRLRLEQSAEALFRLEPAPDPALWQLMFQTLDRAFQSKRMGKTHRLALLLSGRLATAGDEIAGPRNREFVSVALGLASLYVGDIAQAQKFATEFQHELPELTEEELLLLEQMAGLPAIESAEAERRALEHDLPRVRIETSLGPIEVELFEDDAPLAVNRFVQLVESGFYDQTLFHAVFAGNRSQGGLLGADRRQKKLPRPIADECHLPTARKHLYGSLSMARSEGPDSATSQFSISCRHDARLDGFQTVMGRVISGMDVVEELEPTLVFGEENKVEEIEGAFPSTLVKAVVLSKREHDYGIPVKPVSADNRSPANPPAEPGG